MIPPPTRSTLFPYTTLFRSLRHPVGESGQLHGPLDVLRGMEDRKSTRLNSSHSQISYAVFCLKKKTIAVDFWRTMIKFVVSLRNSRRSYFATFRHQLTILSQ